MTDLVVAAGPEGAETTIGGLAALLVQYEQSLTANPPERVVLADASDNALAAALVALKLSVPVEATPAASQAATVNGRLIAQLAGA